MRVGPLLYILWAIGVTLFGSGCAHRGVEPKYHSAAWVNGDKEKADKAVKMSGLFITYYNQCVAIHTLKNKDFPVEVVQSTARLACNDAKAAFVKAMRDFETYGPVSTYRAQSLEERRANAEKSAPGYAKILEKGGDELVIRLLTKTGAAQPAD